MLKSAKFVAFVGITGIGLGVILGCTSATPVSQRNHVSREDAVKIAQQLSYGMLEVEAVRLLKMNGMVDNVPGAGDSFWWNHEFYLADGSALVLQIVPHPVSPDGEWKNGRLEAAFIQKGSSRIAAISLRPASAPIDK